jgi:hypothetical protein
MHPEAILQMHKEKYLMIISNNYRNLANSKYEKAPKNGAFCFFIGKIQKIFFENQTQYHLD